jgi:hypothetical protein
MTQYLEVHEIRVDGAIYEFGLPNYAKPVYAEYDALSGRLIFWVERFRGDNSRSRPRRYRVISAEVSYPDEQRHVLSVSTEVAGSPVHLLEVI